MKKAETVALEKALMYSTIENRTFGVSEVTVGWHGRKRVDFVTTNTKGTISCYEIKVTKSDFHSEHGHNFFGHYNYYVMTPELYKEVRNEIPAHVGVLTVNPSDVDRLKDKSLKSVKRATRQDLDYKEATLMRLYLVRSMSREVKKTFASESKELMADLRRRLDYWRSSAKSLSREIKELRAENKKLRRR